MSASRLVKLYLRVDLDRPADDYRRALARMLLEWQLGLHVQAFEVKEGTTLDVSYYAEIDSEDYQQAFLEYHACHGWNVDEIALLGLISPDQELDLDRLDSINISWGQRTDALEDSEARIFWQRPGRGEQPKSLDCWLVKYDGSPTNRDGSPSAMESIGEGSPVYRKGLLFCGPFSQPLMNKFVRLSFKWERYLREQQVPFRRLDNFADFEEQE